MARIPETEIERLKKEVSLERLAVAKGVELKKHGDNLIGRCPFHDDKTPSFVVTPEKNLWHCLGACQTGGTVIDFVMRAERCSFRLACEMLLKDAPSLGASVENKRPHTTTARLEEIAKPEEPCAVVLRRVVDVYTATLKESPECLGYLGSRELVHAELIDTFQLGFSNRTLGYRLPPKVVKAGAAMREKLQQLGILRESGHEHFNGSLVIPLFDVAGEVVGMYGRKIGENLRPGTPPHLYLPGPHRGVFNWQALSSSKDLILCEALIDALTFWCAGFRNVTSAYGIEGFTPELREAFGAHGIERVLIAYDADDAGNRAAEKLAPELVAMGLSVFRVPFPKGMDANEYAQKVKPAAKSLDTALRSASWMAGTRPVSVRLLPARGSDELAAEAQREEAPACSPAPAPREKKPILSPKAMAILEKLGPDAVAAAQLGAASVVALQAAATVARPALGGGGTNRGESPAGKDELALPSPLPPFAEKLEEVREGVESAPAVVAAHPRPQAQQPMTELSLEVTDEQVVMQLGDRKWRIRGLAKNLSPTQLKVNVHVARAATFFVDQLELNNARHRASFLAQAARELETEERVLKRDLGLVFQKLEELQDQAIEKALEPKTKAAPKMSEGERKDATLLLEDPNLLQRILADMEHAGVVGEETNKLVGYLAAVSRLLPAPLGVVIQSTSAAGKSSLMDAVLSFVPEEERVQYSAMTGQSLYYMGEVGLQHKILAIAEEEGASNASYALKLLQSEGELTIASTGKDPKSGRMETQEYRVKGPVMVMMTTTAIELDEELLNRCLVLTVDDGREQTRAIHEKQREAQTIEGILAREDRGVVMKLHQNAQRLLKPLTVANPYAKELRFADHATRTRRDHMKYLTLINTIALLHQYQRPIKEAEHRGGKIRYLEVTREDIAIADKLATQVLARSMDELAPQTRGVFRGIDAYVTERAKKEGLDREDVCFTQRDVRELSGLSATQIKVHLRTLVELEYLALHRAVHAQRYVYRVLRSAGAGERGPFDAGIYDYDSEPGGGNTKPGGEKGRPVGLGRHPNRPVISNKNGDISRPGGALGVHLTGAQLNGSSYLQKQIVVVTRPDAGDSTPNEAE